MKNDKQESGLGARPADGAVLLVLDEPKFLKNYEKKSSLGAQLVCRAVLPVLEDQQGRPLWTDGEGTGRR